MRSPSGEVSLLKLFRPDTQPTEFTTLGRVRELELLGPGAGGLSPSSAIELAVRMGTLSYALVHPWE